MTGFLASVTSVEEARVALAGGADIIDMKNPRSGALGALPLNTIAATVKSINHKTQTSATTGDLKADSGCIPDAVRAMHATGVDFIKTGFFHGSGSFIDLIDSLKPEASFCKLIAVLFADQPLDMSLLPRLAEAGFHGVMLDTASKQGMGLRASLSDSKISQFVQSCRQLGLVSGLAGQLTTQDIHPLMQMTPDYLGFRSALCKQHQRTRAISARAVVNVSDLINRQTSQCSLRAASW